MSCDISVKVFLDNAKRLLLDYRRKQIDRDDTKVLLALNYIEAAMDELSRVSFLSNRETKTKSDQYLDMSDLPGWEHTDETQ